MYVYLIGSGVVAVFWLVFYIVRPDLRIKMLVTSIIGGILGITEIFFVPQYWNPQFNIIRISNNLFLDSFIFAFFLVGFVAVVYQVLWRRKIYQIKNANLIWLIVPPIIFFLHLILSWPNVMVFAIAGMLISVLAIYLSNRHLGTPMLASGVMAFIFFLIMYVMFWQIFPLLSASYNYSNMIGLYIFTIPAEELMFFFAIGTIFSIVYEYLVKIYSTLKNKVKPALKIGV